MQRLAIPALRLVLVDVPTQSSFALKVSKIGALYSLGINAMQAHDYYLPPPDRILTLLAPLPDLYNALSHLMKLIALSRRMAVAPDIVEGQVALAMRWMADWPLAANEVASTQEIVGDNMASIVVAYVKP
ncbi:hypothetical protein FN846DRAFT_893455 [Sphaerosporella brunnea]|uniref:Uncharacterized protein n=1 Tax=Sphaerosporella brunnea TaxID=1250544 RepID=A0A5J5ELX3_9PEZI|nr:hypothetical protein FN846DRAFT_893455 [Sphaerosporella brunnea]